jgi:hypothetical protein
VRRTTRRNYSSRVYVNNYVYNNSSEALELYPDYEEYTKRRRKTVKKPKTLERSAERMPLSMIKVFVCVGVAFGMMVGFLNVNAANGAKSREILELREELEAINENNSYLETELNETIDLKKVEQIATTKLGMSKPQSYQIKYIDVPKESYTVQYETETKKKETIVDVISNFFKG